MEREEEMRNAEDRETEDREQAAGAEQEPDAAVQQRALALMDQAQAILDAKGPDMLEAFREDPTIHRKVASGEWDFQVAYGYLLGRESAAGEMRRSVPQAVRNPNSFSTRKSIAGMSEREFDALNDRLSRGEVIDPGR